MVGTPIIDFAESAAHARSELLAVRLTDAGMVPYSFGAYLDEVAKVSGLGWRIKRRLMEVNPISGVEPLPNDEERRP